MTFLGLSAFESPTAAEYATLTGLRRRRIPFNLGYLFPAGGEAKWWAFDTHVKTAYAHGVELLPVITGVPGKDYSLPQTKEDVYHTQYVVAAAVQRWPQIPVWQYLNEPNVAGKITPDFFTFATNRVADTIHTFSDAKVMSAGVTGRPSSYSAGGLDGDTFLSRALLSGDFRANYAACHCYQATPDANMAVVARVADAAGTTPYITEFGWPTGGPSYPTRVDVSTQASYLEVFVNKARVAGVPGLYWFGLSDHPSWTPDYWGHYTGLYYNLSEPKPAADVFKRLLNA